MNQNRGLIIRPIEPEHFVFGDAKLGDTPVNPSGDWSNWLPATEDQNIGIEPMACTSFALLNCVETMIRQEYGDALNLSDKFLAFISGTTQFGNDPHTVAETLRTKGDVYEMDWPYTTLDNTWEKFYSAPARFLYTKALEFVAEYSFGHSWVSDTSQASLMRALTYSPLSAGVYAWQLDLATGHYIRPPGAVSEHDVMIYGYEPNQYWKIFDSYAQETKKLAWDFRFDAVKRYTLHRQITSPTAWQKFLDAMHAVIDQLQRQFALGDYSRNFGAERSPEWPRVRAAHLANNPTCIVCGGTGGLQVHHVRPFHIHPELELDPNNLVTLCTKNGTLNCHVRFGHLDNFKDKWNPNIREDAALWLQRFNAKTEQEVFPLEVETAV